MSLACAARALRLEAADRTDPPGAIAYALLGGTPGPDLGNGRVLRFRPSDRKLAQPRYQVALDAHVASTQEVSQRVAVVRVAAEPPSIPYSDARTAPSAAPSCSLEGAP